MRRLFAALVWCVAAAGVAAEPELATPPAGAETWLIVSGAGEHGKASRWVDRDGVRWSREEQKLRGMSSDIDQELRFAADGSVVRFVVRGRVPQGDAAETYEVSNGRYTFKSPVDSGSGAVRPGLAYAPFGGTIDATIALIDALRRSPTRALDLLPSGRLTLEPLTTAEVASGGVTKRLTGYAITGFGFAPSAVWYEGERFFAFVDVMSYVPEGWAGVVPALSAAQNTALAARAPRLVAELAERPQGPVVFSQMRIFDADARQFVDDMTVIVEGGVITAVAPTAAITHPADARVIDGRGMTLVPGLWDNHLHFGDDSTGPLLLSQGITSIRDPGNQPAELMARKKRIEAGALLGPRIVPSLLIDGPGERSAQAAVVVKSEAETLAAIRRAKADGYFGVKLYGSLDRKFVRPMADEAHRLGLRVHGHIPAGMRPLDAVRAGYDEITHINFVMMQAMPDEVVADSNGLARMLGPARYAGDVDFKAPAMAAYLDELAQRKIAIDPTLPVIEIVLLGERGKIWAPYRPFEGTLPPSVERGFKSGGLKPQDDLKRETIERSIAKMQALVVELHKRGVTVLAGTDGFGFELVRELELYVGAGMSNADALAAATIVPARTFGVAAETGSIAAGKKAELALVKGDPSTRIGDLRNVEMVMQGEKLMRASALRAAIGISGPPKTAP